MIHACLAMLYTQFTDYLHSRYIKFRLFFNIIKLLVNTKYKPRPEG